MEKEIRQSKVYHLNKTAAEWSFSFLKTNTSVCHKNATTEHRRPGPSVENQSLKFVVFPFAFYFSM
jgi:hypothetical protein